MCCIVLGYSQGILNSFGLGTPGTFRDVASAGVSSSGLIPGSNSDLSLMNPSTWSSSKYSLFSSTFVGEKQFNKYENIENQYSNINWVAFIVPIKKSYSLGIGLFPYSSQNIRISKGTEIQINPNEYLLAQESVSISGGISSLRFAFGFPIKKIAKGGVSFDILFGSTRVHRLTEIDNENIIFNQRKLYNGIIAKFYYLSNLLSIYSKEMILYASVGGAIKKTTADVENFQPFLDRNQNGVHDISLIDFPGINNMPAPEKTYHNNFYQPIEINIGTKIKAKKNIYFIYEGGFWKNNSTFDETLFEFENGISEKNNFTQGLIRYAEDFPSNFIDRYNRLMGYQNNTWGSTYSAAQNQKNAYDVMRKELFRDYELMDADAIISL